MSMLSSQADELRLMARLVRDYDYKEISRMLREAANTIESMSDKLQGVMGTRYCELFGTPERAARTMMRMCDVRRMGCDECPLYRAEIDDCNDYAELLEWLRGDA